MGHMNDDHSDSTIAMVQHYIGLPQACTHTWVYTCAPDASIHMCVYMLAQHKPHDSRLETRPLPLSPQPARRTPVGPSNRITYASRALQPV